MKKSALKILKSVLVFTLFVLISTTARTQYLYFCEDVDDNGDPVEKANSFIINSEGGYLYFYVDVGQNVNCTEIHYSIYSVDSYGSETYENSIYQDVEKTWAYFWKKVNFYHTGDYNVYVYDDNYNQIAKGTVRIKM
jgi:hypothetical protein